MYDLFQKNKKNLAYFYIIFLAFSIVFVNLALKNNDIKAEEKVIEKASEVKQVKVTLKIDYLGNIKEYKVKLRNEDTVLDLLEYLRDNEGFEYEKIAYTYGMELIKINDLVLPEGLSWKLFQNENDITHSIQDINLENDAIYTIKVVSATRDEAQQ